MVGKGGAGSDGGQEGAMGDRSGGSAGEGGRVHRNSSKLSILHLVSYPLYSGAVPPTVALAQAQRSAGHRAWVACDVSRDDPRGFEESARSRDEVVALAPEVSLTLSTRAGPVRAMQDVVRLRRWLVQQEVDVLHVHQSHDHALAAAAMAGLRSKPLLVRTIHATRSLAPRLGQAMLQRQAGGWVVRCAEHKEALCQMAQVGAGGVAVIPGSVDAARFGAEDDSGRGARQQEARRRFGLDASARVLGHVALMAGRGQEELLAAVRAWYEGCRDGDAGSSSVGGGGASAVGRGLQVLFVGTGENEGALQSWVRATGLQQVVRFTGYLADDGLLAAYDAMDAAFLAQPGNDGSARAALEAMAAAKPVLGVRAGALGELLREDMGYPLSDRRPETVLTGLRRWLADGPVASLKGASGRRWVSEKRTVAQEAERTIGHYRQRLGVLGG